MMFAWSDPPTDMSLTISPQWLAAKTGPAQPYDQQGYEFTMKFLRFISRGQIPSMQIRRVLDRMVAGGYRGVSVLERAPICATIW